MKVIVTNIRNTNGEIEVALFNNEEGFPNKITKAYKVERAKITNGTCTVIFENIPYGLYALGVYHDENGNKKLDRTWFGMPKEGIAVSNNPKLGVFNPPDFATAKFNFDKLKNNVSIKIKYI